MAKKTTIAITDVTDADKVPPPATARPIVVKSQPILKGDPMLSEQSGNSAKAEEGTGAPIISRSGKALQPLHSDVAAEPTPEADAVPETEPELAKSESKKTADAKATEPAAASVIDIKPAETKASSTGTEPAEKSPEPDTSEKASQEPAESTDTPAAPDGEAAGPADASAAPQRDANAATEAAAAEAEAAAAKREAELQHLVDSRKYYVPVNAVEQKRNVRTSLWLTLLVIVLSIILVDFMLDANFIELLTKLPHTHFFSPNPHF